MDKTYNLDILPPAQAELEEIARVHMALSGVQSARRITDKIYDAMEQLMCFPLSGPPIRDDLLSAAGYRYILASKYLIIYRLLGDTIVIYHIAHGATDYPKLLATLDKGKHDKQQKNGLSTLPKTPPGCKKGGVFA